MVTKDELRDLAILSKLQLDADKLDELTEQMAQIVDFADTINAYDGEIDEFDNINNLQNVMRDDVVEQSYPVEEILKNVDGGQDGYFPVKMKL